MHIERNVAANVMNHLFGDKDTAATRRDMEQVGRFQHLWLQQSSDGHYLQPRAPYVFTDAERCAFIDMVSRTKTPSGYSGSLQRHVNQERLRGMKSHDYHVLVQDILPASIRNFLHPGPREAIIRLGQLFKRICAKVVVESEIADLQKLAAETLCLFELWFPPGFFDVMSHLVVHLVEEVDICGPVHARWCYSIERYMGNLAKYVRKKGRPEAGMAHGYAADEALGFCTEYFDLYPHSTRRMWDPDEELGVSGELLLGGHRNVRLGVGRDSRACDFAQRPHGQADEVCRLPPSSPLFDASHCLRNTTSEDNRRDLVRGHPRNTLSAVVCLDIDRMIVFQGIHPANGGTNSSKNCV